MEEIKLPKFKTKEELEQFAMGLMTENESLKCIISRKDLTIKEFRNDSDSLATKNIMQDKVIKAMKEKNDMLAEKVKELSQQPSQKCEVNYKGMYESEVERVRLRDDIGDVLYKSMSWLYSRVPFWTKKKFRVYFQKLVDSNDNLRGVSEKMVNCLFLS